MITSIAELDNLLEEYNEIKEKIYNICVEYCHARNLSIEWFAIINGNIEVSGTECICGCNDYAEYSFPTEWLFLSPEELDNAYKEKLQKDLEEQREKAKREAEKAAKELEIKEKAELARLKAKYEQS